MDIFVTRFIIVSLSSKVVNFVLAHDGRKRKYSDPEFFDSYLEGLLEENSKPYFLPEKWDFGVPQEIVQIDGENCYVLNRGKESAVLYLHGGSAIHQPLKYHYRFIKRMLERKDMTVYLPIYPLAPAHTYKDTFSMLDHVYDMMLKEHDSSRITIMGDSMGGNLALSFPQTLIGKRPMCGSIVLLSPWLDMSGTHPDTEKYIDREPRLSLYELKRCGELWAGGLDLRDPIVSPIYGPLEGLPRISVYVGTEELLLLDSERLRDRAEEEGHELDFHLWEGMSHVFPVQPIKEAKMVLPDIVYDIG